jgi:dihydrofolate reductase/thymidylate synthase
MKEFSIVVAATQSGGIGKDNGLPWPRLVDDMKFFRDLTTYHAKGKQNAVIMGRKTWDSLPAAVRPLVNRINVVISRTKPSQEHTGGALWVADLDDALRQLEATEHIGEIFVIGGASLYQEAVRSPLCSTLCLTRVLSEFPADKFLPNGFMDHFEAEKIDSVLFDQKSGVPFQFQMWTKKRIHEEQQYLDLVQHVLETGEERVDRTGTGTLSVFAPHSMRFDLRNNSFPLITTKPVAFRLIAEELRWFCSGSTDINDLDNCHIWDDNASRKALDNLGLFDRRTGDAGPIYGHQMRRSGANYTSCDADYTGQGFDQLADVIKQLKTNKSSRRIIIDNWDPSQMHKQALPACHVLVQFSVNKSNELSCQMYQRSCDLILGCPFNIASYSLLCIQLAAVADLKPGIFTHVIGDAHIYKDHIAAARIQISRKPFAFPTLQITRKVASPELYKREDMKLQGYQHHASLGKLKMSV